MSDISRVRNIAFAGSHHAGKTTLVESVLAHCGAIGRKGSVIEGTTVTDHEPECISHAQSTTVGFAHAECGDVDLTMVDCPGFIDFFEETKTAIAGADAVVIVVEADPSRIPQTHALVEFIESRKLPHLFVINKLDRPGSDFAATLAAVQSAYGRHVVAEQLPVGVAENFTGYIDLARRAAYSYDGTGQKEIPVPDALVAEATNARSQLLEALSDFDDHLMEELLEGVEPPLEEIEKDLCAECAHDQIVPVVVAAGLPGSGTSALLAAIEKWFPSPLNAPQVDAEGRPIEPKAEGPIVAHVIKTLIHPQSGKLSVVRVLTGTLRSDATLTNISKNSEKVRSAGLYRLQGKKQEAITQAGPGSIVAIARLETVATGDTLTTDNFKILLPRVAPSEPTFAVAIRPKERLDEAKISQMLARILDEDPSLRLQRAEFTNELQLLGNGEQHVSTAVERLGRKYNVAVEMHPPMIPYRETITGDSEVHARYKHQTGGHGQFGDVWLRIQARDRGHGVTFEQKIVGGVVPRQFFPAVEKGVREALQHGPVSGYPVTDLHVVLYDGSYHSVDSSEQSFKTAAAMAMRDGLPKCNPVVLEPIVRVQTSVPSAYTSAVIQLLTGKRGQILGMNPAEKSGFDIVEADVPQVELSRYISELRTATQGLGSFSWQHERFDPVPSKWVAPKETVQR
ncbi:MAG: elongation factor G [Candidatus Eremiobacteraeota bacterium]|nr:elongation factor G [Candidatus Eremiobacteraeota bacterium]